MGTYYGFSQWLTTAHVVWLKQAMYQFQLISLGLI